jgi:homoserine O-acetyltransferase
MSRRALFADAECTRPRPRDEAMRLFAPLSQLLMPRTPEALEAFGSQQALLDEISRLEREGAEHGPDAFDWRCQSRAYDAHDVGTTRGFDGDTERALACIEAEVLIAAPLSDLYNPPFAAREAARTIRRVQVVELPGHDGHRSASGVSTLSTEALRDAIRAFLR